MRITLRGKRWLSSIGVGRKGDAGLIITGNVMVDRHALTGPAGVVLEDDRNLGKFRLWADAVAVTEPRPGCKSIIPDGSCWLQWGNRHGGPATHRSRAAFGSWKLLAALLAEISVLLILLSP